LRSPLAAPCDRDGSRAADVGLRSQRKPVRLSGWSCEFHPEARAPHAAGVRIPPPRRCASRRSTADVGKRREAPSDAQRPPISASEMTGKCGLPHQPRRDEPHLRPGLRPCLPALRVMTARGTVAKGFVHDMFSSVYCQGRWRPMPGAGREAPHEVGVPAFRMGFVDRQPYPGRRPTIALARTSIETRPLASIGTCSRTRDLSCATSAVAIVVSIGARLGAAIVVDQ
jgi:hypothetical protein